MADQTELKQAVVDFFKSQKGKHKFMINDIKKKLPGDVKKKDLKAATNEMVAEGTLTYWSSGSTTYFMLPETGENLEDV